MKALMFAETTKTTSFKSSRCPGATLSLAGLVMVAAALLSPGRAYAHCPTFGGGIGIAGPITTFSASTIPEGKFTLGARAEVTGFEELSPAALDGAAMSNGTAHSLRQQQVYSLGAAYGITDDFTLGVSLPYVLRDGVKAVHFDDQMGMSMQHDIGASNGLGDLTVFGQYRLVRKLYEGIDFSLVAGLKVPTGVTDNGNNGSVIETEHQPGSGSWDPLAGVALSKRFERLSLHLTGLYSLATRGSQATDLGDRAQLTLAAAYRFGGKANLGDCDEVYEYFYPQSRQHWLGDLVLEVNGNWQDKEIVAGVRDDSSGGTVLYLSPGGRVTYDGKYSGSLSVGVPVYQQLNGIQSKIDYRIIASLAVAF